MKDIKLQSSNLNNSIRFYNLLFNARPVELDFQHADYQFKDFKLRVEESDEFEVSSSPLRLILDLPEYKAAFKRVRPFTDKTGAECFVLRHGFNLHDPDGNEWILSERALSEEEWLELTNSDYCFLEPINF